MIPLIVLAYAAYAGGLLLGFAHLAWIAMGAAVVLAIGASVRGDLRGLPLALLLGAGAVIATASPEVPRAPASVTAGPETGTLLERVRYRAGRSIDRDFGADAPLVRALLIADRSQLPLELRDKFAAAGLVHMLAISGLHVAVIAGAIQLVFLAGGAPAQLALIASVLLTALYVAMIGAPPAAVRAAIMLGIFALSKQLQRPSSPWAALAVGAFLPLVNPRLILEPGYQLSVLGMCALIASSKVDRRMIPRKLRGIKRRLARDLVRSTVACAVTAPLVAWTFGRMSLIGPVSNLVAGPVISLLQPMLFLGLVLAPVPAAATFVASAAHPLIWMLSAVAGWGSAIPWASVSVSATKTTLALAALAVAAGLVAASSRFPARAAITGAAAVALIVWLPRISAGGNGFVELHVLDVGQGDAILLRTDKGRWILFDAGPAWETGDAGRSVVIPYLQHHGANLDAFVLSHPHTDHVGGATSVFRAMHPRDYWDAAFAGGSEAYSSSLREAQSEGIAWHRVHPGDSLQADGATVRFLAPDSAWTVSLHDPNLASTIALITFGSVRFLLVGDAERAEEDWLIQHTAADIHADVLKVGHHGSATSSSDEFLRAVEPRVALVSVGVHNLYHHPSPDVMRALRLAGAEVIRTDESGTIVARTDGHSLQMEVRGETWEVPKK